ncbi:MAG TPA: hypothetical protein VFV43_12240 [Limnobacter sp.]|nr:hypothetical protein [Limnobacter sp.]
MRIKAGVLLIAVLGAHATPWAQEAREAGSISIRSLAEHQRKIEQQEFLNKLSGQSSSAGRSAESNAPAPDGNPATQAVQGASFALEALMEQSYTPKNTILAIYGPVEKLTMEVADGKGGIEYFTQGQRWGAYRIVSIGQQGAVLEPVNGKGKRLTVPLGGQL